jgi:hypothetical protein
MIGRRKRGLETTLARTLGFARSGKRLMERTLQIFHGVDKMQG